MFGEDHRTPEDEPKLQFDALSLFDEEEIKNPGNFLSESLILKHNAKRAFADQLQTKSS